MINIITGKVNSGKSSKLIEIYKTLGKGDGFFNRKIFRNGCCIGQEIVQISSSESRTWSLKDTVQDYLNQDCSNETYSFSEEGLKFAEKITNLLLMSETDIIYIDEIGPLELQEKGFHNLFRRCIESKKELYVVIREECLKAVLGKYNITDYKIIYPQVGS